MPESNKIIIQGEVVINAAKASRNIASAIHGGFIAAKASLNSAVFTKMTDDINRLVRPRILVSVNLNDISAQRTAITEKLSGIKISGVKLDFTGVQTQLNALKKSFSNVKFTLSPTSSRALKKAQRIPVRLRFNKKEIKAFSDKVNAFFEKNPIKVPAVLTLKKGATRKQIQQNLKGEAEALKTTKKEMDKLTSSTKAASKATQTFGERVGFSTGRLTAYLLPAASIFQVVRAFRAAKDVIVDVNRDISKLTQIFQGNAGRASKVAGEILSTARALGQSGRELLSVTALLAQSGAKFKDNQSIIQTARALAQTPLAATFGTLQETTQGVVAVLNQFNLAGKDTLRILAAANELSKNFAFEAGNAFAAVQTGGAAFAQAGGTAEEFLATVAAIRQLTRISPRTIGTGLNTITLRILRKDTVAFLEELTGGKIRDAQGELKGVVEILKETSIVYNGLGKEQKAAIVSQVGGIRQGKILAALFQDIGKGEGQSEFLKALETAKDASGSLARDTLIGLNRIDIELQTVGASFEQAFGKLATDNNIQALVKDIAALGRSFADIAGSGFVRTVLPSLLKFGAIKLGVTAFAGLAGFGRGLLGKKTQETAEKSSEIATRNNTSAVMGLTAAIHGNTSATMAKTTTGSPVSNFARLEASGRRTVQQIQSLPRLIKDRSKNFITSVPEKLSRPFRRVNQAFQRSTVGKLLADKRGVKSSSARLFGLNKQQQQVRQQQARVGRLLNQEQNIARQTTGARRRFRQSISIDALTDQIDPSVRGGLSAQPSKQRILETARVRANAALTKNQKQLLSGSQKNKQALANHTKTLIKLDNKMLALNTETAKVKGGLFNYRTSLKVATSKLKSAPLRAASSVGFAGAGALAGVGRGIAGAGRGIAGAGRFAARSSNAVSTLLAFGGSIVLDRLASRQREKIVNVFDENGDFIDNAGEQLKKNREAATKAGILSSVSTGLAIGASLGFVSGGPIGAGIGAAIGAVGGFAVAIGERNNSRLRAQTETSNQLFAALSSVSEKSAPRRATAVNELFKKGAGLSKLESEIELGRKQVQESVPVIGPIVETVISGLGNAYAAIGFSQLKYDLDRTLARKGRDRGPKAIIDSQLERVRTRVREAPVTENLRSAFIKRIESQSLRDTGEQLEDLQKQTSAQTRPILNKFSQTIRHLDVSIQAGLVREVFELTKNGTSFNNALILTTAETLEFSKSIEDLSFTTSNFKNFLENVNLLHMAETIQSFTSNLSRETRNITLSNVADQITETTRGRAISTLISGKTAGATVNAQQLAQLNIGRLEQQVRDAASRSLNIEFQSSVPIDELSKTQRDTVGQIVNTRFGETAGFRDKRVIADILNIRNAVLETSGVLQQKSAGLPARRENAQAARFAKEIFTRSIGTGTNLAQTEVGQNLIKTLFTNINKITNTASVANLTREQLASQLLPGVDNALKAVTQRLAASFEKINTSSRLLSDTIRANVKILKDEALLRNKEFRVESLRITRQQVLARATPEGRLSSLIQRGASQQSLGQSGFAQQASAVRTARNRAVIAQSAFGAAQTSGDPLRIAAAANELNAANLELTERQGSLANSTTNLNNETRLLQSAFQAASQQLNQAIQERRGLGGLGFGERLNAQFSLNQFRGSGFVRFLQQTGASSINDLDQGQRKQAAELFRAFSDINPNAIKTVGAQFGGLTLPGSDVDIRSLINIAKETSGALFEQQVGLESRIPELTTNMENIDQRLQDIESIQLNNIDQNLNSIKDTLNQILNQQQEGGQFTEPLQRGIYGIRNETELNINIDGLNETGLPLNTTRLAFAAIGSKFAENLENNAPAGPNGDAQRDTAAAMKVAVERFA